MTKYIFITGGVVSSLGKGIASASLGAVLEARKINVSFIKLDPYLNVDPGTMNPSQHGEVFVTADGAETDLDLGHYERFVNITLSKKNNFTAGRIYANVLQKERQGVYLGGTVQVIPHVTDEIKQSIQQADPQATVMIVEIGGTVGDIESLPFLEAIRQMRIELGVSETLFIHLGLVPYIQTAGEIKTKPVQHSVKELRTIGIQPDIIICRSEQPLPKGAEEKIALFTNVEKQGVISLPDKTSIYEIPVLLHAQGLDHLVLNKLNLPEKQADLACWVNILQAENNPENFINIAIIGKYTGMADCYKSLGEALKHAGIKTKTRLNMQYVDAEHIEKNGIDILKQVQGIIVPGGFGQRGTEGKIMACRYARENRIPYLGICLGMQIAIIEFARHVAQLTNANSTEFDPNTPYPVICLIDATGNVTDIGGTMRLGNQACYLEADSLAEKIYGKQQIQERHRHRYEVNPLFSPVLTQSGMSITGRSGSNGQGLVELIELSQHPFFMACQFHPEFISTPRNAHPLFEHFVRSMIV